MTQVQAAITQFGLFNNATCFYSFDPMQSMNYPAGDQFIVIQPNNLNVKQRAFGGTAGQVNYMWKWDFTLWLFIRLATDEAHRDNDWLSNQTFGSLITVDSVINTLQNYTFNDNGNLVGFELQNVMWQNKDRQVGGWGYVRLAYKSDFDSRSQ